MSSDDESVHSIVEEIENELELHLEDDNVEVIEEQATEEANGSQNVDEAEEEKAKRVVKPKRVVKNPQPKLNEQTLRGPRGLSAIEGYFQRVKFKGKGHEEHDLNVLLKTYEYWCHRLFPKFPYDNCIARLETLGAKRGTQTLLKLIRMDMAPDREIISDEEEKDDLQESGEPTEDAFDQLLPSINEATQVQNTSNDHELPEDIQERIRQNKERAEKLRRERLQRARDQAAISLPGSNRITDSQSSVDQPIDSQTEKHEKEGTIEDLLDEINSQDTNNQQPQKKIHCEEEIGKTNLLKNKSPSKYKRSSNTTRALSESSDDEMSHQKSPKKHTIETLTDGVDEQEHETKSKKKKVKVIDSDSDFELDTNNQEKQNRQEENEKNRQKKINCEEEIGKTNLLKNKSPSKYTRSSNTTRALSESSDDEMSQQKSPKKHEQEYETKNKKVKVIDSDSDFELDTNNQEKQKRQEKNEKKTQKKRTMVIHSDDDEEQTEKTIDELLDVINTTESLDKKNAQKIKNNDLHGNDRKEKKKGDITKWRLIDSEEQNNLFPNEMSNSIGRKAEDACVQKEKHIPSNSEESCDGNDINKDNIKEWPQDGNDTSFHTHNSVNGLPDTNIHFQSTALNEDKNKSYKETNNDII